ncbi:MAG: DNA primase [Clostridiales bacterium]|nr:DNA primase [Clostridiales bacterium]
MAIPDSFLDEVNARTDIVDLVSSYVQLQKKGSRYWACCPFHSEKTPSFCVSPDKQMYYCFGCHKGGGAISFVMEEEGAGFVDAVAILAQRAGLQMPEADEDRGRQKQRERLYALNKEAARYFNQNLSSSQAESARRYLADRGLSRRIITNFGMGYAFNQWDALIKAMAEKGYSKKELLDAGLVVANQKGNIYDRFRGRVIFPIIDLRGNVIGFGGRVLDDTKPKYLNSPDTPVYNKSKNLFAMNIAKKSKAGRLILTEGYMDTISLHQGGFDCAVASLGTSLTEDHARLMSKYTKEVILAYDGDAAGVAAAQRAIGILTRVGLEVRVLHVTGAKDPDEFIKKYGRAAFQKLLDGSEGQVEYRLLQVQKKYDLTEDSQKVEYLQEAARLIAQLSSPVEREIYGGRAAAAAGVDRKAMDDEVTRQRKRSNWQQRRREERRAMTPAVNLQPEERRLRYQNMRSAMAEEGVIALALMDSDLLALADDLRPEQFSSELLGRVYGILRERWQEGKSSTLDNLTALLAPEEVSHLTKIMQQPQTRANNERALADYINTIQTECVKRQVADDSDILAVIQRKTMEEPK